MLDKKTNVIILVIRQSEINKNKKEKLDGKYYQQNQKKYNRY